MVPVLLAAWSILNFSGCGAWGTARDGALSYTTGSSWHFFTLTGKPAEVHSHECAQFAQGCFSGFCAFRGFFGFCFFHNPGGFLIMFSCLSVGARCCRMSRLAVTCGTAVGAPVSPVSLSKEICPAGARKTWAVPRLMCLSTSLSLVPIRLHTGCCKGAGKSLKRKTQF